MRGQYQTPGPDDPAAYDIAELGADITAVADATQASHLLGHSFGGLVARAAVLGGYSPDSLTLLGARDRAHCRARRTEELHFFLSHSTAPRTRTSRTRSRSCGPPRSGRRR